MACLVKYGKSTTINYLRNNFRIVFLLCSTLFSTSVPKRESAQMFCNNWVCTISSVLLSLTKIIHKSMFIFFYSSLCFFFLLQFFFLSFLHSIWSRISSRLSGGIFMRGMVAIDTRQDRTEHFPPPVNCRTACFFFALLHLDLLRSNGNRAYNGHKHNEQRKRAWVHRVQ